MAYWNKKYWLSTFWLASYWSKIGASIVWWPIARIMRDYLIEQSVGYAYSPTTDWSIATAAMPKRPLNCVAVYDEQALKKYRSHVNGIQEDPVISIEIRATEYEPGHYKAKKIMEAMDSLSRWIWVGDSGEYSQTVMIANARRTRGVLPLGMDDNGRWVFNLEYALVIQSIDE